MFNFQRTPLCLQYLLEVADGLLSSVNGGPPNFVESHRLVKGVGGGIGRIKVHLADDPVMAGTKGRGEEIAVEQPGDPVSRSRRVEPLFERGRSPILMPYAEAARSPVARA